VGNATRTHKHLFMLLRKKVCGDSFQIC